MELWCTCNSGSSCNTWKGSCMWVEPSWISLLQDAASLWETHFGMKQTSSCLFLFSMKCKYSIASAAGHHTSPVLGFSFLSLVPYPVPFAVTSREPLYCIELSDFFLGEQMGTGSPERTGRQVETNVVLLCQHSDSSCMHLLKAQSYWTLLCARHWAKHWVYVS